MRKIEREVSVRRIELDGGFNVWFEAAPGFKDVGVMIRLKDGEDINEFKLQEKYKVTVTAIKPRKSKAKP